MASLENTNWLISHETPGDGPVVSVHTQFLTAPEAKYGPYAATFSEDGDSFVLTVPQPRSFLKELVFKGNHNAGTGSGTAEQIPSPPGRSFEFTMHKL